MDRIQAQNATNAKQHRLSLGHHDSNIDDILLGSVKFEEIPNTTSISASAANFDFNAIGRRRSQSQGVLKAAKQNLYDQSAPDLDEILNFNLSESQWEEDDGVDSDAMFSRPLSRRKPANSFHSPIDFDYELSTATKMNHAHPTSTSPLRPPFSGFSASMSRDRAESDFGRYSSLTGSSMKSPLAVETEGSSQRIQMNSNNLNSQSNLIGMNPPTGTNSASSKNDWTCSQCGNQNYAWRHVCNMRKCRAPKPGHLVDQTPPGSWACLSCGNLNYAERMICNMRKCRAPRPLDPAILNNLQQQQPQFNYNMYMNMMQQQQQQQQHQTHNLELGSLYSHSTSPQSLGIYGNSPKMNFMINSNHVNQAPNAHSHPQSNMYANHGTYGGGNLNSFHQSTYSVDDLQNQFENGFHVGIKSDLPN